MTLRCCPSFCTGVAERMGGAQGKYIKRSPGQTHKAGPIIIIDCGRESGGTPPNNFEVLHALKCVLGASEAPFLCMHTVHTYLLKLPSSLTKQLQIEKYDVRGPS